MSRHATPVSPTRRQRNALLAATGAAAALAIAVVGSQVSAQPTWSTLTQQKSVTNNLIRAGYMQIDVTGPDSSSATSFDVPALAPGDSASKTFMVTNNGTIALNLDLATANIAGTAAFASALTVTGTVTANYDNRAVSLPSQSLSSPTDLSPSAQQRVYLGPGNSATVTIQVLEDDRYAPSAGDKASFDLAFTGTQSR